MQKWLILLLTIGFLSACSTTNQQPVLIVRTPDTQAAERFETTLSEIELTQNITGENDLTGAQISVDYPANWTAEGNGTDIRLTNRDIENSRGSDGVLVNIRPAIEALESDDFETASDVLTALAATSADVELEDQRIITLAELSAAFGVGRTGEALLYAYAVDAEASQFVLVMAVSQEALADEMLAIVRSIAHSVDYQAGDNLSDAG